MNENALKVELEMRLAGAADLAALMLIDAEIAPPSELPTHRRYFENWVADGACWLAFVSGEPIGLAVLHRHFFHRDFVELLLVRPGWQGRSVGRAMLRRLCRLAEGPDLWISTNRSNARMQHLLVSEGFDYTGIIEGMDEGDPELFYRRKVTLPNS